MNSRLQQAKRAFMGKRSLPVSNMSINEVWNELISAESVNNETKGKTDKKKRHSDNRCIKRSGND